MSYPKHEEVLSLRSFDSWLDRFCAKHRNLAVPNLMLYIVIGNVIVFVLDMFSRSFPTISSMGRSGGW